MKAEAGQEVAGWQLTSVAPAKVLLERQGGRLELKLPFKAASRIRVPIANAVRQPQAPQQPAAGQQAPAAQQQPAAAAVPPPPQEQPSAQEIEADQEPS